MSSQRFNSERFLTLLDYLGNELDPSILIGGWATQLRVGGEISYDIDLIINSPNLRNRLRELMPDFSESNHLGGTKKVRGTISEIHIDAYLPHESTLGRRLRLDVAKLAKHIENERVKGWQLLTLEAHLITKFAALLDRPDSEKGAKDAREVFALLDKNPNESDAIAIFIDAATLQPHEIPSLVEEIFLLLPDRVTANKEQRRKLHNLRRTWVDEAERQVRRLAQGS